MTIYSHENRTYLIYFLRRRNRAGGTGPQLSAYRGLAATGAWISGHCAAVPTTRRCVICEAERVDQLLHLAANTCY